MKAAVMKMVSSISVCLILLLTNTQGVSSQTWRVTFTHDHICAVRGSSVVMSCSFTHPPHLKVTKVYWIIDAKQGGKTTDLLEVQKYKGRVQYSTDIEKNCTMTLSDVKDTDTALYYVRIETSTPWQKWQSSLISFRVKYFAHLKVQTSGPAIEGWEVTLSCVSDCRLRQNYRIVWRKDGHVLPDTQTHNNELTLHSIMTENEGEYSCAVEGQEYYPSPPLKIDVMYPPKRTLVLLNPKGKLENNSVMLTCSSDANPPVENYIWYRRTEDKTTQVGLVQTNTFTLTSATAGLYHCQATNGFGSENSAPIEISLTGEQSPVLTAVVPVLVCAVLCLLCVVFFMRKCKTEAVTQARHDQSGNANTIQLDAVYQNLNPNTTQPDAVYQSMNPNITQPDAVYQSLNPNTTPPDAVYQSLNPNTIQPDAVYEVLDHNTT